MALVVQFMYMNWKFIDVTYVYTFCIV